MVKPSSWAIDFISQKELGIMPLIYTTILGVRQVVSQLSCIREEFNPFWNTTEDSKLTLQVVTLLLQA
ncbi:MAG: hypothetical protein AB1589_34660 [Cyanobacteriota bacterium]